MQWGAGFDYNARGYSAAVTDDEVSGLPTHKTNIEHNQTDGVPAPSACPVRSPARGAFILSSAPGSLHGEAGVSTIHLSGVNRDAFLAALESDARPNDALLAAAARFRAEFGEAAA